MNFKSKFQNEKFIKLIETLVILCLAIALFYFLYISDSFELLVEWSRNHEEYEIDEFILMVPVGLLVFLLLYIKTSVRLRRSNAVLESEIFQRNKTEKK